MTFFINTIKFLFLYIEGRKSLFIRGIKKETVFLNNNKEVTKMTELALPRNVKEPVLEKEPQILFEEDAGDIALANMLVEIIKSNIKDNEKKLKAFMTLKTTVYLCITDAEVEISLNFDRGKLMVQNGKATGTKISIITDSSTLMDLSNLKTIFLGLPNFFDELGLSLLKKLLSGELTIKGLFLYLFSLIKLTKILAVSE